MDEVDQGRSSCIVSRDSNNGVRTIAVQADGRVLVGGNFPTVDSVTRNRIIRLNPNGSLDTDF